MMGTRRKKFIHEPRMTVWAALIAATVFSVIWLASFAMLRLVGWL